MTTVNTEHLSRGWALIAEGAQYISMAYASNEPPVARAGVAGPPPPEGAAGVVPPTPATPAPIRPQLDAALGICPVHGVAWVVKPAGVSKAGKKYSAFWKCAERDDKGYCDEKPQKIWQDTHPPNQGAAA